MLEVLFNNYRYPNKNACTSAIEEILLPTCTLFGYKTVQYDPSNQEFKEEDQKCNNVFFRILMLPVSVVLIPITVIACIVKALDPEVKKVHALYQERKNLKPDFKGIVEIEQNSFGYLGADKVHHFSDRIKLMNRKNLKTSVTDFYCEVSISTSTPKSIRREVLPSSLFIQAKVGNQLRFLYDDKLWELDIKTGTEEYLKQNAIAVSKKDMIFGYNEDVPEDYVPWVHCGCTIFLSPEAKKITIGRDGIHPLDFDSLTCYSGSPGDAGVHLSEHENGDAKVIVDVPGSKQEDIDLILDKNFFYIYATSSEPELLNREQYVKMPTHEPPPHIFAVINFAKYEISPQSLDLEKTSTKLENGRLTIQFFAKK